MEMMTHKLTGNEMESTKNVKKSSVAKSSAVLVRPGQGRLLLKIAELVRH